MNAKAKLIAIGGLTALVCMPAMQARASVANQASTGSITAVGPGGEVTINGKTYHVVSNAQNDSTLKTLQVGDRVDVNLGAPSSKPATTIYRIRLHPAPSQ